MARMGNWRDDKDKEIPLDGIGGVNILVKADVHRSGTPLLSPLCRLIANMTFLQASTSHATPSRTRPRPRVSPRWRYALAITFTACQTTSSGTSIQRRSLAMRNEEVIAFGSGVD